MLKFANTYMYYFFAAVPLLILALALVLRWKAKQRRKLLDPKLAGRMVPDYSQAKFTIRYVLISLVYVLFTLTLARPKFGMKVEKTKAEGFDFVIALDVSNSMLAEDIQPNRLIRAKQAINSLLDKLDGESMGLVVFAGMADLQSSLTMDYASLKNLLAGVGPDMLPVQGTSISEAIQISMKAFPDKRKRGAAIVIISDGEDHEGAAIQAAKDARNKGIFVHTIGIGSPQGGAIPIYDNGVLAGYKTDRNNQTVISKMNEAALQEVAGAGGGIYVRGTDPTAALKKVYEEMKTMDKAEQEELNEEGLEDRYQWVLGAALLLLVIELLISDRTSKWIKKIELFD